MSIFKTLTTHTRQTWRKLTAIVLFALIIVVFVFWNMNQDSVGFGSGGAAATVNSRVISLIHLEEQTQRVREQYGDEVPEGMQSQIRQEALRRLIQFELSHQGAQQAGIWVPDEQIRDVIVDIPVFSKDGRFQRDYYMAYLQNSRQTAAQFEERIRQDEMVKRAFQFMRAASRPTPMEIEKQKSLADMKANAEFIAVPTETLVKPSHISAADAQAFLAKEGSEQKVKEYFEINKETLSTKDRVRARHILVRAEKGNAEAEKKALEKATALVKSAKAGEDFSKLAKANSEDPGSKEKGGDLGFFERGRMVPEFEQAAFAQEVNAIGEPVKTDFGYHILQVLEKQAAKVAILDEQKPEIAKTLVARERSDAELTTLKEMLKAGDVGAVQKWVQRHELKWEETGSFSIDRDQIPKIGFNEEFARVAFGLTPSKPVADTLLRSGSTAYVVRYKALPVEPKAGKKDEKNPSNPMQMAGPDPENPEMMAEVMAQSRANAVLTGWVDTMRKTAKIEVNQALQAE